jgi:hypothetical protein
MCHLDPALTAQCSCSCLYYKLRSLVVDEVHLVKCCVLSVSNHLVVLLLLLLLLLMLLLLLQPRLRTNCRKR